MKAIDLFAGAGGTTSGVKKAGVDVIWAANHNPKAVEYHALNHPETIHSCQDLHQADFSEIPAHDVMFASPCCQGHSKAAGRKRRSVKADKSRSTAWAVISCAEVHMQDIIVVENVSDFQEWNLFPVWEMGLKMLGYSISKNLINARQLGIPQNRQRMFYVATKSANPIELTFEQQAEIPAASIIDFNQAPYKWDLVSNRVEATQRRVRNGRRDLGDVFLDAAYGTERSGRSIHKPLGTVTTVNKHSLVIGDRIRPLTVSELARAQSFDDDYLWPESSTAAKTMIGNAVPPLMAKAVIEAIQRAA